ncbi:MAG: hypothetical protein AAFX62_15670 [Pseudomonadota bacterium]
MVKMSMVELFPDVPSEAPISTSAAFRITHGLRALSNNCDRHEMRLT